MGDAEGNPPPPGHMYWTSMGMDAYHAFLQAQLCSPTVLEAQEGSDSFWTSLRSFFKRKRPRRRRRKVRGDRSYESMDDLFALNPELVRSLENHFQFLSRVSRASSTTLTTDRVHAMQRSFEERLSLADNGETPSRAQLNALLETGFETSAVYPQFKPERNLEESADDLLLSTPRRGFDCAFQTLDTGALRLRSPLVEAEASLLHPFVYQDNYIPALARTDEEEDDDEEEEASGSRFLPHLPRGLSPCSLQVDNPVVTLKGGEETPETAGPGPTANAPDSGGQWRWAVGSASSLQSSGGGSFATTFTSPLSGAGKASSAASRSPLYYSPSIADTTEGEPTTAASCSKMGEASQNGRSLHESTSACNQTTSADSFTTTFASPGNTIPIYRLKNLTESPLYYSPYMDHCVGPKAAVGAHHCGKLCPSPAESRGLMGMESSPFMKAFTAALETDPEAQKEEKVEGSCRVESKSNVSMPPEDPSLRKDTPCAENPSLRSMQEKEDVSHPGEAKGGTAGSQAAKLSPDTVLLDSLDPNEDLAVSTREESGKETNALAAPAHSAEKSAQGGGSPEVTFDDAVIAAAREASRKFAEAYLLHKKSLLPKLMKESGLPASHLPLCKSLPVGPYQPQASLALDDAKELKKQGNGKYKEGKYEEAKQLYSDAIGLLSTDNIHSTCNKASIARVKADSNACVVQTRGGALGDQEGRAGANEERERWEEHQPQRHLVKAQVAGEVTNTKTAPVKVVDAQLPLSYGAKARDLPLISPHRFTRHSRRARAGLRELVGPNGSIPEDHKAPSK